MYIDSMASLINGTAPYLNDTELDTHHKTSKDKSIAEVCNFWFNHDLE